MLRLDNLSDELDEKKKKPAPKPRNPRTTANITEGATVKPVPGRKPNDWRNAPGMESFQTDDPWVGTKLYTEAQDDPLLATGQAGRGFWGGGGKMLANTLYGTQAQLFQHAGEGARKLGADSIADLLFAGARKSEGVQDKAHKFIDKAMGEKWDQTSGWSQLGQGVASLGPAIAARSHPVGAALTYAGMEMGGLAKEHRELGKGPLSPLQSAAGAATGAAGILPFVGKTTRPITGNMITRSVKRAGHIGRVAGMEGVVEAAQEVSGDLILDEPVNLKHALDAATIGALVAAPLGGVHAANIPIGANVEGDVPQRGARDTQRLPPPPLALPPPRRPTGRNARTTDTPEVINLPDRRPVPPDLLPSPPKSKTDLARDEQRRSDRWQKDREKAEQRQQQLRKGPQNKETRGQWRQQQDRIEEIDELLKHNKLETELLDTTPDVATAIRLNERDLADNRGYLEDLRSQRKPGEYDPILEQKIRRIEKLIWSRERATRNLRALEREQGKQTPEVPKPPEAPPPPTPPEPPKAPETPAPTPTPDPSGDRLDEGVTAELEKDVYSGNVKLVDTVAEPEMMQTRRYKGNEGAGENLRDVKRFSAQAAAGVIVYRPEQGPDIIVEGHHRRAKAIQLNWQGKVGATILREQDGWTKEQASRIGALRNLQLGTFDAVDAQGVFRGMTSAELDAILPELPRNNKRVSDGLALAKLSDEAMNEVLTLNVPPNHAALVGEVIQDPNRQMLAIKRLAQKRPKNAEEAMTEVQIVNGMSDGDMENVQTDLLGNISESAELEKLRQIVNAAVAKAKASKELAATAKKKGDALVGAGLAAGIDKDLAQRLYEQGNLLGFLIQSNAFTKGPFADKLREIMRDYTDAGREATPKQIQDAATELLRVALNFDLHGQQTKEDTGTPTKKPPKQEGLLDDEGNLPLPEPKKETAKPSGEQEQSEDIPTASEEDIADYLDLGGLEHTDENRKLARKQLDGNSLDDMLATLEGDQSDNLFVLREARKKGVSVGDLFRDIDRKDAEKSKENLATYYRRVVIEKQKADAAAKRERDIQTLMDENQADESDRDFFESILDEYASIENARRYIRTAGGVHSGHWKRPDTADEMDDIIAQLRQHPGDIFNPPSVTKSGLTKDELIEQIKKMKALSEPEKEVMTNFIRSLGNDKLPRILPVGKTPLSKSAKAHWDYNEGEIVLPDAVKSETTLPVVIAMHEMMHFVYDIMPNEMKADFLQMVRDEFYTLPGKKNGHPVMRFHKRKFERAVMAPSIAEGAKEGNVTHNAHKNQTEMFAWLSMRWVYQKHATNKTKALTFWTKVMNLAQDVWNFFNNKPVPKQFATLFEKAVKSRGVETVHNGGSSNDAEIASMFVKGRTRAERIRNAAKTGHTIEAWHGTAKENVFTDFDDSRNLWYDDEGHFGHHFADSNTAGMFGEAGGGTTMEVRLKMEKPLKMTVKQLRKIYNDANPDMAYGVQEDLEDNPVIMLNLTRWQLMDMLRDGKHDGLIITGKHRNGSTATVMLPKNKEQIATIESKAYDQKGEPYVPITEFGYSTELERMASSEPYDRALHNFLYKLGFNRVPVKFDPKKHQSPDDYAKVGNRTIRVIELLKNTPSPVNKRDIHATVFTRVGEELHQRAAGTGPAPALQETIDSMMDYIAGANQVTNPAALRWLRRNISSRDRAAMDQIAYATRKFLAGGNLNNGAWWLAMKANINARNVTASIADGLTDAIEAFVTANVDSRKPIVNRVESVLGLDAARSISHTFGRARAALSQMRLVYHDRGFPLVGADGVSMEINRNAVSMADVWKEVIGGMTVTEAEQRLKQFNEWLRALEEYYYAGHDPLSMTLPNIGPPNTGQTRYMSLQRAWEVLREVDQNITGPGTTDPNLRDSFHRGRLKLRKFFQQGLRFAVNSGWRTDAEMIKMMRENPFYIPHFKEEHAYGKEEPFMERRNTTGAPMELQDSVPRWIGAVLTHSYRSQAIRRFVAISRMVGGGQYVAELQSNEVKGVRTNGPQVQVLGDNQLVLRIVHGGRRRIFIVPREDLALVHALMNLSPDKLGSVIAWLHGVKRFIQANIKVSLSFLGEVYFKEMMAYPAISRRGLGIPNPIHAFVRAGRQLAAKKLTDKEAKMFYNGMIFGISQGRFSFGFDTGVLDMDPFHGNRTILGRFLAGGWKQAEWLADTPDMTFRRTEAEGAEKAGMSPHDSAAQGTQIMDWTRAGAAPWQTILHATVPFWNAAMLGPAKVWEVYVSDTAKFMRSLRGQQSPMTRREQRTFLKRLLWTALGVALMMGLMDLQDDEPLTETISDEELGNSIYVPYKTPAYYEFVNKHGREPRLAERKELIGFWRFPVYFEPGMVHFSIARLIRNSEAKGNVDTQIKASFLRNLNPFGMQVWPIEAYRAITKKPRPRNEGKPILWQEGDLELSNQIGQTIGVSPDSVDRWQRVFFQGMMGDLMRWADDIARDTSRGYSAGEALYPSRNLQRPLHTREREVFYDEDKFGDYLSGNQSRRIRDRKAWTAAQQARMLESGNNNRALDDLHAESPGFWENLAKNDPIVFDRVLRGYLQNIATSITDDVAAGRSANTLTYIFDKFVKRGTYDESMKNIDRMGRLLFALANANAKLSGHTKGHREKSGIMMEVSRIQGISDKDEAQKEARKKADVWGTELRNLVYGFYNAYADKLQPKLDEKRDKAEKGGMDR